MAERNILARVVLVISILIVVGGIYLFWRHTRMMVQHDNMPKTGNLLVIPGEGPAIPRSLLS